MPAAWRHATCHCGKQDDGKWVHGFRDEFFFASSSKVKQMLGVTGVFAGKATPPDRTCCREN